MAGVERARRKTEEEVGEMMKSGWPRAFQTILRTLAFIQSEIGRQWKILKTGSDMTYSFLNGYHLPVLGDQG